MRVFLEKNRVLGLLEAILSLFGTILYNMPLFGVYFEGLQKFLYPKFSKVIEKNNISDIEPKLLRKISRKRKYFSFGLIPIILKNFKR